MPDVLAQRERIEGVSLERRFLVSGTDREEEIDLYGEGRRDGRPVTVVGEVKSRIYAREVGQFGARISRIRTLVSGEIVPVMFEFVIHPSVIRIADELGILLVASRPGKAA